MDIWIEKYKEADAALLHAFLVLSEAENILETPRFKVAEIMHYKSRILEIRAPIWPQTQEGDTSHLHTI